MAKSSGENGKLNLKVNIDTDDAVRSLKTLQRTARLTAKELRELESFKDDVLPIQLIDCDMEEPAHLALKRFTTKELTEELMTRKGITKFDVDPYGKLEIFTDNGQDGEHERFTGPAIVLVNQD